MGDIKSNYQIQDKKEEPDLMTRIGQLEKEIRALRAKSDQIKIK
jgi:hypothetical protein